MTGCTVTEVKSGEKKRCQFPFTTKGETFYQCTDKVGNLTFDKPWCSTKTVRKNGQNAHVPDQGHYGEDCHCKAPVKTRQEEVQCGRLGKYILTYLILFW